MSYDYDLYDGDRAMLDALVGWIHESLDDAISTARTLLITE